MTDDVKFAFCFFKLKEFLVYSVLANKDDHVNMLPVLIMCKVTCNLITFASYGILFSFSDIVT